MTTWNYIIGNEKDFEGAPDWAMLRVKHGRDYDEYFIASMGKSEYQSIGKMVGTPVRFSLEHWNIIAQREPVESPQWVYYLGTPEMFARMSESVTHLFRSKLTGVITGVVIREAGEWFKDTTKELIGHRGDHSVSPVATNDVVNHPSHYTQGGIECIDAITAATVGKTGIEAVCVANVVKYLWRYEEKNGLEDVEKARWYLERLIKELESNK